MVKFRKFYDRFYQPFGQSQPAVFGQDKHITYPGKGTIVSNHPRKPRLLFQMVYPKA